MSTRVSSLSVMLEAALVCRDKGHHWKHRHDEITRGSRERVREVKRHFDCAGCTTHQVETLEFPTCRVISRSYEYPDGYLLEDGKSDGQRIYVADVRRELLARQGLLDRPRKAGAGH